MFLHCIFLWMNWWTWHARLFGDMYSAVFFDTPNTMNVYIQPNIFKSNIRFNENGVSSAWRNGVLRFQQQSQRFKAESLKVWYVGYPWNISQSCRCKPPIYPLSETNELHLKIDSWELLEDECSFLWPSLVFRDYSLLFSLQVSRCGI